MNLILVSFKSTDGLECQFISNLDLKINNKGKKKTDFIMYCSENQSACKVRDCQEYIFLFQAYVC